MNSVTQIELNIEGSTMGCSVFSGFDFYPTSLNLKNIKLTPAQYEKLLQKLEEIKNLLTPIEE